MKKQVIVSLLAGVLMAGMLPGVALGAVVSGSTVPTATSDGPGMSVVEPAKNKQGKNKNKAKKRKGGQPCAFCVYS